MPPALGPALRGGPGARLAGAGRGRRRGTRDRRRRAAAGRRLAARASPALEIVVGRAVRLRREVRRPRRLPGPRAPRRARAPRPSRTPPWRCSTPSAARGSRGVDFFLTEDGPVLNEVNTTPGHDRALAGAADVRGRRPALPRTCSTSWSGRPPVTAGAGMVRWRRMTSPAGGAWQRGRRPSWRPADAIAGLVVAHARAVGARPRHSARRRPSGTVLVVVGLALAVALYPPRARAPALALAWLVGGVHVAHRHRPDGHRGPARRRRVRLRPLGQHGRRLAERRCRSRSGRRSRWCWLDPNVFYDALDVAGRPRPGPNARTTARTAGGSRPGCSAPRC